MSTSIVGFGKVGQAIAAAFARKQLEVAVAGRRPPATLAPLAAAIGPSVVARPLADALAADTIILAVPFPAHREVAQAGASWHGKIVVDATNAYGIPPGELGDRPSSVALAGAFPGARIVKAFNHLPAATIAADPAVNGGRRVVFLSGDDEDAVGQVAALVARLGFAPVPLGGLAEGGRLIQASGQSWAPLIFQDLVSFR